MSVALHVLRSADIDAELLPDGSADKDSDTLGLRWSDFVGGERDGDPPKRRLVAIDHDSDCSLDEERCVADGDHVSELSLLPVPRVVDNDSDDDGLEVTVAEALMDRERNSNDEEWELDSPSVTLTAVHVGSLVTDELADMDTSLVSLTLQLVDDVGEIEAVLSCDALSEVDGLSENDSEGLG